MADVKISGLPTSTVPLAGTEVLPIVQGGQTRQVSVSNITAGRSVSATNFIPTGSSTPTNGMYLPATNTLAWSTNSAESMRLSSTGIFSIGDSSAATNLTPLCATFSTNTSTGQNIVVRKSVDTTGAAIVSLAKSRGTAASPTAVQAGDIVGTVRMDAFAGTNYRNIGQMAAGVEAYVSDTNVSGYLIWSTNNAGTGVAERMRLFAAGGLSLGDTTDPGAGNLRLGTGNLVIGTSGKGIDFSVTPNPSGMQSELFADYEEGVWTPILTTDGTDFTSVTYSVQNGGWYVRIGKTVFVHGTLYATAVTVGSATGSVVMGGLPYANMTGGLGGPSASAGSISNTLGWVTNAPMALLTDYGGSRLYLRRFDTAGTFTDIAVGNVASGTNFIQFAMTYQVD